MSEIGQTPKENFIIRIWNGDAGSAMTYWVYGVVAGFVWGNALAVFSPLLAAAQLSCSLVLWLPILWVVYIGISRPSNKLGRMGGAQRNPSLPPLGAATRN